MAENARKQQMWTLLDIIINKKKKNKAIQHLCLTTSHKQIWQVYLIIEDSDTSSGEFSSSKLTSIPQPHAYFAWTQASTAFLLSTGALHSSQDCWLLFLVTSNFAFRLILLSILKTHDCESKPEKTGMSGGLGPGALNLMIKFLDYAGTLWIPSFKYRPVSFDMKWADSG